MESDPVKEGGQNIQKTESEKQQQEGNSDQNINEHTAKKYEHKQESDTSRKSEEQSK